MHQFIDFYGNEKCRFPYGHPTRPTHTKYQADAFHQRKHTVNQSPRGSPEDISLRQLSNLTRQVGPEFSFWIEPEVQQEILVLGRQIVVGKSVCHDGERQKK